MVRGCRAELLAEKIENQIEFDIALKEGFKYFQGYFFCRPTILGEREIPPNRQHYLRLLVELSRTPLNLRLISSIVESEPSLCYRLLRLANSALMGLRCEVTSVPRAMMVIGEDRFRILASIAASSALGYDQPQALINLSLERARFCEIVAPLIGQNPTEQYMLGLLSLVDAILQTPMAAIVKTLPLRRVAKAALLGATNPVALPLTLIKSFEQGDWGPGLSAARELGVGEQALASLYMDSLHWAAEALAS
jgi:EAL and modified HD-GYP domain-containing signal transduction protein